ncbi:unnamed protein product [Hyaloperonospora brassicae]|uniref:Uncharacterized protein n=1 Tax=Hyaloperonospora brassicae TaxID=162125 RepID=A0AAV0USI3_HYABA|nr:unnamed protein product [Hyaloperonospora brassicae]
MFIGMFRELHPRASSPIDTAELLFASRDGEVLDAHLKEIADQPGYDALARSLRELHNELKDFRSSAKKKIGFFDKMKLRKQCAHAKDVNPDRRKKVQKFVGGKKFWSFAGLEGPINVKELEEFLMLNGKGPDPFVHEWTLIIPLVVVKGVEDVVQALSSLHDLKNNKIEFVKLHNALVTYCHHFGVSSAGVWMALGLDPQKVYEMLSLHTCVQNALYAATAYEWFKYVEMYRAVHPKCALGFKEARKLFALQHDTNRPEQWITYLEESKNDEHEELAKMLRKPYDEMLEKESSKLLADTGR